MLILVKVFSLSCTYDGLPFPVIDCLDIVSDTVGMSPPSLLRTLRMFWGPPAPFKCWSVVTIIYVGLIIRNYSVVVLFKVDGILLLLLSVIVLVYKTTCVYCSWFWDCCSGVVGRSLIEKANGFFIGDGVIVLLSSVTKGPCKDWW